MRHLALAAAAPLCLLFAVSTASAQEFTYDPPGSLEEPIQGRVDDTVYVPGMRFPVELAPAYPNSQVWGVGGFRGPPGGQCDERNYSYPWKDNYCETRQWDVPLCPSGNGHQGQDIRPGTCEDKAYWVVSAEAGEVTQIGTYSVYVVSDDGTRHRYLHMDPPSVPVRVGDRVERGERLGLLSNAFGGTPTTIHLHYDIFQTVAGVGPSYVPTYFSLIRSYEELLGQEAEPCGVVTPGEPFVIDDGDACFRLLGSTQFWRRVDDAGYDGDLKWTAAFTSNSPGAFARWTLEFEQAGDYTIEAFITPEYAQSKQVGYVVTHDGQTDRIRVDQSAGDGWLELGTWAFAAGGSQSLVIEDNTGEPSMPQLRLTADAIRITRAGVDPPADMGAPPADMGAPPVDMGTEVPGPRDMSGGPPQDMSSAGTSSTSSSTCICGTTSSTPGSPWAQALLLGLAIAGLRRERA